MLHVVVVSSVSGGSAGSTGDRGIGNGTGRSGGKVAVEGRRQTAQAASALQLQAILCLMFTTPDITATTCTSTRLNNAEQD